MNPDDRSWRVWLEESDTRRERLSKWLSFLAVSMLLVSGVGFLYLHFSSQGDALLSRIGLANSAIVETQAYNVNKRLDSITNDLAVTKKTIIELNKHADGYAALAPGDREALNGVIEGQKTLDVRLKDLEDALRVDAAKSLAVPLIRKDIDALQDSFRANTVAIQTEMGRLYGLVESFLGLMFTIALGFFGLAITNYFRSDRRPPKEGPASSA